jgi:hypothetical protein
VSPLGKALVALKLVELGAIRSPVSFVAAVPLLARERHVLIRRGV